ncbi:hypothetical protein BDZ91DRAFT_294439 [Kalaharituber pfeilii]|nr:hypothetical protein BDZ91DRAFT_294439 [Kalaharituber pfeilii]
MISQLRATPLHAWLLSVNHSEPSMKRQCDTIQQVVMRLRPHSTSYTMLFLPCVYYIGVIIRFHYEVTIYTGTLKILGTCFFYAEISIPCRGEETANITADGPGL